MKIYSKKDVSISLINPPFGDPTAPYHSLSYLVGAARSAGYSTIECIDANVECLNELALPSNVTNLISYCNNVVALLDKKKELSRLEQLQYLYSLRAQCFEPHDVKNAIDTLKCKTRFFDPKAYSKSISVLENWLDAVSTLGYPGQFDRFSFDVNYIVNFSLSDDLVNKDLITKLCKPFEKYLEQLSDRIAAENVVFVGISIPFLSQLLPAIKLASLIRKKSPNTFLCAGGTELSDVIKYSSDSSVVWKIFNDMDCLVVGEGESAFVEILNSISSNGRVSSGSGVWMRDDWLRGLTGSVTVRYENMTSLPAPDYSVWRWDQYWAPSKLALYSPTRGCYWNKCTFCDYGLNTDGPTSPSREREVEKAVDDISNLKKYADYIYFAVDAMSPSYLKKICEKMLDTNINTPWCAELRLEKTLKTEFAALLRKSGCVAISFGFESGCQKVLDAIDKGVNISNVPLILEKLKEYNIASQLMGFVGFPTENSEDAVETFDFILNQIDNWSVSAIGDFVLTSGSIVAKSPCNFKIIGVYRYLGEDVNRSLYWKGQNGEFFIPGWQDVSEKRKELNSLKSAPFDRPFVGGVDSTHSIIYYDRFGSDALELFRGLSFSPIKVISKQKYLEKFTTKTDVVSFVTNIRSLGRGPAYQDISVWLSEVAPLDLLNADSECYTYYALGGGVFLYSGIKSGVNEFSDDYYKIQKILLLFV